MSLIAELEISSVAEIIQIAIAPVFLLAGISALLAVMTNRLTRVVDRWRRIEKTLLKVTDEADQNVLQKEMKNLFGRGSIHKLCYHFCNNQCLTSMPCNCIIVFEQYHWQECSYNNCRIIHRLY